MREWQPIETAPKTGGEDGDGPRILVCDGDRISFGFWRGDYRCWCVEDGGDPVHWMPSPPLPKKAGSGAAEASEPSPPPTAPPLLEWGPDGPRLSEYERKRLERDDASGGVCDACNDAGTVVVHGKEEQWDEPCPACTRRKGGTDA